VVLANVRAITDELRQPEGALLGTLNTFAQMMRELSPLLRNLTAASQEMNRLAADAAVVGERIRAGQGALGGLTDSASPLSRQITASTQKLQAVMTGLEALAVQLPGYGQRVEWVLRQTETITAKLAQASARLPGLMEQSRGVADNVGEVVDSVKRSAVLRALTPAADTPTGPLLEAPRDWGALPGAAAP